MQAISSLYWNIWVSFINSSNCLDGKSHKENKSFREYFCLNDDILFSPVDISYFNTKNFFTRKDTDQIGLLHEINELRSNMKFCRDKA